MRDMRGVQVGGVWGGGVSTPLIVAPFLKEVRGAAVELLGIF